MLAMTCSYVKMHMLIVASCPLYATVQERLLGWILEKAPLSDVAWPVLDISVLCRWLCSSNTIITLFLTKRKASLTLRRSLWRLRISSSEAIIRNFDSSPTLGSDPVCERDIPIFPERWNPLIYRRGQWIGMRILMNCHCNNSASRNVW